MIWLDQKFLNFTHFLTIRKKRSLSFFFNLILNKEAFTYDVKYFGGIFDLPTYPNQILCYIRLFSKIR